MNLRDFIGQAPDFPKKGINFLDICPLLQDPDAWKEVLNLFSKYCDELQPDLIVGIESRGFILGSAVASYNGLGFIPIRKAGKLPGDVISQAYSLEYGNDIIEIQKNRFKSKTKVLLVDDLLATGGTASAASKLLQKAGAVIIGYGFIIELCSMNGRDRLNKKTPTKSLLAYY